MQAANRCLQTLRTGKGVSFGAWQMLPGTNLSRMLADSGFDWICIDLEHGNLDDAAMHESVPAIAASGVSPIVRIPANEHWMVKRALDAGAHGICVPQIDTVEEVRAIVASSKFPPLGRRGFGSPFANRCFGAADAGAGAAVKPPAYLEEANDALVTIIQIESASALAQVDAIAREPGVDVLLVGPYDLANALGLRIVDGKIPAQLREAMQTVVKAAKAHGKWSGMYALGGQQAKEYADMGFNMISVAADVMAVPMFMRSQLAVAKQG